MADLNALPPGLAGYVMGQQNDNQQQTNLLQQLLAGVQIQHGIAQNQVLQKQLATKAALGKALMGDVPTQPAASSAPYGGGYSPDVARAFGVPAGVPPVTQTAPSMSNADRLLAAAKQAGDYDAYQEAIKLKLEEKKAAPKYASDVRVVMMNGKPTAVQMADDGSWKLMGEGIAPAEKLHFADNGQSIQGLNPYTGAAVGGAVQKFQTPDSIASNRVTMRGQDMVDARKREELQGAEAAFTPEAIDNAAARYNIDGTLPPMGMGKTGAMGRSAILNRAAEFAAQSGLSGDEQRIQQIGNAANKAALTKLQSQQTMVGAFERNFNKNADMALEYSGKVDRTGVPIVNAWINAGKRSIAGNPELSGFDLSIKAAVNEYAKIISGSMGNTAMAEGEIKKVESLLNAAQTPAQVQEVIGLMKRETQNRMAGFDEEKKQLIGSMGSRKPGKESIFKDGQKNRQVTVEW